MSRGMYEMTTKKNGDKVVHPAISEDVIDRLRMWVRSKSTSDYGHVHVHELELALQGRQSWNEITVNQALDRLLSEAGY